MKMFNKQGDSILSFMVNYINEVNKDKVFFPNQADMIMGPIIITTLYFYLKYLTKLNEKNKNTEKWESDDY